MMKMFLFTSPTFMKFALGQDFSCKTFLETNKKLFDLSKVEDRPIIKIINWFLFLFSALVWIIVVKGVPELLGSKVQ